MIATILRAQRAQIAAIADAWLSAGAEAFAVWAADSQLARWPPPADGQPPPALSEPTLRAAIRLDNRVIGELRLQGPTAEIDRQRLLAEAGLVAHLARLERDLNSMTSELIDAQDQLLAIYDLNQATRNYLDMAQLLKQLAYETNRLVKVESAFLILETPDDRRLVEHYPAAILDKVDIAGYLSRVQNINQPLLLNGIQAGEQRQVFESLLLMPIQVSGHCIAALGLVNKIGGDFTSPNIKLARAIAEHAGARIESVLLYQENLARARLQTEMELAQKVQLNLLPRFMPSITGLDIWAASHPASQVGGDFFDFILKPDRPFIFAVGDVSGKGLPAAMLMTMMRTIIRTKTGLTPLPSPEDVMRRSNEDLYDDFTELSMFATVFVGHYYPERRELIYANAGHSPVVFCPAGGEATLLEADGTAVGILPDSYSENQRLTLNPGDVLVVATDGINEARNARDELFGYDRLLQLVTSLTGRSAHAIADALLRTAQSFSVGQIQDDDQTLVVLKAVAS